MIISKSINSDLLIKDPAQEVYAVQGDCYTREVILRLHANKIPWAPTKPVSVAIRYRKPDGTGGTYDTLPNGEKAWKLEGNSVSFLLAPQMLTVPGRVAVQVELLCNDSILASFPLYIVVTEDTSAGVVPSKDYFNWQQRLEDKLTERLAEAKKSGEFNGATGATPKLRIGTVTTLENDSSAFAEIRGSAEYPILDLYIPKGADAAIDSTLSVAGSAADAKSVGSALAGKASAGFGYGDVIKCYDWTANENNFNTKLSVIFNAMPDDCVKQVLCVDASVSSSLCTCTLTRASSTMGVLSGTDVRGFRRQKVFNGAWQPWEWENPPIQLGVEYRTTEHWGGKAVYTVLMDCGALPDGGAEKQIPTNISGISYIVRCAGVSSAGSSLPLDREGYGTISVMATPTEVILRSGADNASLGSWLSAYCQLWYVKD